VSNLIDFLIIDFNKINLLINKNEYYEKIESNNLKPINSKLKHFNQTLLYKNQLIPIYDLNLFITKSFSLQNKHSDKEILILKVSNFEEINKNKIYNFYKKNNAKKLSIEYLGFKISKSSDFISIDLEGLKLLPKGLEKLHNNNGIFSLNFTKNKIQYLIDVERFFFNNEIYKIKK
jgi:hypothetical protein